jgi:dimethylargininase
VSAMKLARPARAVAREVSSSYAGCLRSDAASRIDVGRARAQHAAYVEALRSAGIEVTVLAADDACPDCCFIEDTAVITGENALATRPGAPARRAEVPAVEAALGRELRVQPMEEPCTLDGGDVLRAGSVLFVGLSARTNVAGAERLRDVARLDGLEVALLEVRGGLHLKSACTLVTGGLLVYDAALLAQVDLRALCATGLSCVVAEEPSGANVLALGDVVLVSAAAPRTAARLAAQGVAVQTVDVSEMHKGDGALTCLSLRLPAPGTYCA